MDSTKWVYLFFLATGTLIIHFGDLKRLWQKDRINAGLVESEDDASPYILSECDFSKKKIFIFACLELLGVSFIFSVIILIGTIYFRENKAINSLMEFFDFLIKYIFAYLSFMSFSALGELSGDLPNKNAIDVIARCIHKCKTWVIVHVVAVEKRNKRKIIKNLVDTWVSEYYDKKDTHLATLLLCINDDFLCKKLPDDMSNQEKDEFNDFKLDNIYFYNDSIPTLNAEIYHFFESVLNHKKIKLYVVLEFFKTAKLAYKKPENQNLTQINGVLLRIENENPNKKKNKKNLSLEKLEDAQVCSDEKIS